MFGVYFILLNPLRPKIFRGNINIYSHFVSFIHIGMTQILKILPQVRGWPIYSKYSISWLLMSWRRKEPGHQQPCYWPSFNKSPDTWNWFWSILVYNWGLAHSCPPRRLPKPQWSEHSIDLAPPGFRKFSILMDYSRSASIYSFLTILLIVAKILINPGECIEIQTVSTTFDKFRFQSSKSK